MYVLVLPPPVKITDTMSLQTSMFVHISINRTISSENILQTITHKTRGAHKTLLHNVISLAQCTTACPGTKSQNSLYDTKQTIFIIFNQKIYNQYC